MPPMMEHTLSLEELNLQLGGRDWLIVNKQQTGFYHVLYDRDNLNAIARQLQQNHTVIHASNRAALFQDLAPVIERNEIESVDVVLELFKYLEFEENLMPWNQVANTYEFLECNLFGTASHSKFKQFMRRLVRPTFQRLFRKHEAGEAHMDILAHADIVSMACRADLPECLEHTQRLAYKYIFNKNSLEAEYPDIYAMHDVLLCMGLRHQTDENFNKVIDLLYVTDNKTMFYDDVIYALRCTQNHRHWMKYLNILMKDNSTHSIMNENDTLRYLLYVFKSNMASRSVIWHFIEDNYKMLSHSTLFVQIFNYISEYVPDHRRSHVSSGLPLKFLSYLFNNF